MARTTPVAIGAALALCGALAADRALACGCFTPPDPSVPLVQAGERILFSIKDGEVTAHIQIQYSGKPGEFGWLLPLPSVPLNKDGKPGIDLGVDELFTQLINATQPKYRLQRIYEQCGNSSKAGEVPTSGLADGSAGPPREGGAGGGPPSPLIARENVGPYETAILDGRDLAAARKWLEENKFFVPQGTYDVAGPYAHPGAYFVAVRLRAGQKEGDLQPVVVRYRSDYPMIPIVLTSVGAVRNMGVQVWMLGAGRAIPRNYHHTFINDSQINWFNAGQNYNDVIIKAVGEAPGKHSFVTEYAGTAQIVQNALGRPDRFNLDRLQGLTKPAEFVQALLRSGFTLNTQLASLLSEFIPMPERLAQQGVTLLQFYQNLGSFVRQFPEIKDIEPAAVIAKLKERIVDPTLAAAALLQSHPYLTRLYTTISPEDMNRDPVFSYNRSLADYPNVHQATLTYHCNSSFFGGGRYGSATLVTESGWRIGYTAEEADRGAFQPLGLPYSQRIETLREVGAPEVLVDNSDAIRKVLEPSGCAMGGPQVAGAAGTAGLLAGLLGMVLVRVRRRRG